MKVDKVDFAIITILPEEYEAIYTRFNPEPYIHSSGDKNTYGISHVQTKDGKQCAVAITRTSRAGNDASQQLANQIINDLDPKMLLVVGIGGGVPDNDFTLGDVIVSSHIHNFDVNAIKGNKTTFDVTGGIHPRVSQITANLYLYKNQFVNWNNASSIIASRPSLLLTEETSILIDKKVAKKWQVKVAESLKWHFDEQQRGARAPKFLTGTIASSNTLMRSDTILAQWLEDARSIRAVEMEVAGVYQAAQRFLYQYPVMAIRGISDIVGFQRDDDWKLYACHTAAAFAYAFVTSGIVEPRENTLAPDNTPVDVSSIKDAQFSQGDMAMPQQNNATQNNQKANAINISIIYADADKTHKDRLRTQLAAYMWNGMIDVWDKECITANSSLTVQEEVDRHIDSSQIILLLISPYIPASKQCISDIMRAMQRRKDRDTIVIPIYIRPTNKQGAPFEDLLSLPRNDKPVNAWSSSDEAWYNVALDISKTCDSLRKSQSNP